MMNRETQNNFKDIFPPTPGSFTRRIDDTVRKLPERGGRWRLPAPAIAGYAAAACVTAALVLCGLLIPSVPGGTPKPTDAAPSPGAGAADDQVILSLATLPPLDPLPQLAKTEEPRTPAAADGWQAVAYSEGATWYYQPSGGKLACTKQGRTVSFALDLKDGQSVGGNTFLMGKEDRWLAFTVHEANGDKVWVVTGDGSKLVVPDDIRLVNLYNEPVTADLTGSRLFPYDNETIYTSPLDDISNGIHDGMMICVQLADGSVYRLEVSLCLSETNQAYALNDRRGRIFYTGISDSADTFFVAANRFVYPMEKGSDGKYQVDFRNYVLHTDARSNRFSFFRCNNKESPAISPSSSLFIYEGDPKRELWEMNMYTGKTVKAAEGCLAAGWLDTSTIWYVLSDDATAVHTQKAKNMEQIIQESYIIVTSNYGKNDYCVDAVTVIRNKTNSSITIPDTLPGDLEFLVNGSVVWTADGQFKLEDAAEINIWNADGSGESAKSGPVTVAPEGFIEIKVKKVPYTEEGEYRLKGTLYSDALIDCSVELPFAPAAPPPGISITGTIAEDGRLNVTVGNQSHITHTIYEPTATNSSNTKYILYPCTIRYRLFSGDVKVGEGVLPMADRVLSASERNVAPGESLTLVEPSDIPCFALLSAGNYRLQWAFSYAREDDGMAWEQYGSNYLEMNFTVPK